MLNMEKLKLYIITKPSSDGTFNVGDIIWLSENGDLNDAMAGGWLPKNEWDVEGTNDFKYKECKTHYLDIHNGGECIRKICKNEIELETEYSI